MEFGIFAQLFVPKYERDVDPMAEHKRIMRNVEVGVAADRTGVKYVWCPEHHFLDEYSHMPGPEVYLSYLAARTERVHVGSAIFNITPKVNHPARVAETVALLDHITEGRFEFGTGRGSSTTEVFGFDIDDLDETSDDVGRVDPRDPEDVEGRASTPTRARTSACRRARCSRSPTATPTRPCGSRPGARPTFAKAGAMGLGAFCFTHGTPEQDRPADRVLQGRRRRRRAGRRLRQRQHHGRDQHDLHGGPRGGVRDRRQHRA